MKITERYLWIAGIILAGFVIQNTSNNNSNLETLLHTYEAETNIQDSQISDFTTQLAVIEAESYSHGFEAGKTQAGIALVKGEPLYDYADGYHAGISQGIEQSDVLEISAGIMSELNSLRQTLPRLMKQVESLTIENERLKETDSDYTLDLLLETLSQEEEVETSYLEILELLTEPVEFPVKTSLGIKPRFKEGE